MKLSPQDKKVLILRDFKRAMGIGLSKGEAKGIWGENISEEVLVQLDDKKAITPTVERKIKVAKRYVNKLPKFGLVRYVGVSGSVGAGFAHDDDDIDLFVVVRDHTVWLYRFFLKIVGGKETVWYGQEDQKDKICLNFLCEERGLLFENQDIFTLNEIYSLESVFNREYRNYIYYVNQWLVEKYFVQSISDDAKRMRGNKISILLLPFDILLYLAQIIYMSVMRHSPNLQRLWDGYKKGRIEFYPESFREEKLKEFNEAR